MDFSRTIDLGRLRRELVRIEDSVIFALVERAQFALNAKVYEPGAFAFKDFDGSFLDYFLHEIESKVRRYTSPEEHPFTSPLPELVLPPLAFPQILAPNDVNVNDRIKAIYINDILPMICRPGTDDNYGSTATRDVEVLQILSRRIHYGKFVAEAKFNDPKEHDEYVRLIRAGDRDGIMELLTNRAVEERLLRRLKQKALVYGQEIDDAGMPVSSPTTRSAPDLRIPQDMVANMYERFVIPLTKEVEVEYLMQRLGSEK
nr:Chorismate mutase 1-like protein [Polyrhizophydium stewartii]